jgi:hypothetical protein
LNRIDYNIELQPELREIPGMISHNERKFLYQYAEKSFDGAGKIVDLGCWLGATSLSLASGLRGNNKNNITGKQIFAYDLFYWDESLEKHVVGTRHEKQLKPGDSFVDLFRDYLKLYSDLIEPVTDLVKTGWNGDKIEFLLVDAMKKPETAKAILRQFYRSLIPGKSLIYHQDFDHYLTPWVHIIIYLCKPYCRHIHDVPGRGGSVFLLKESLPDSIYNLDFMSVSDDVADSAFKYCLGIASKSKHHGIAAAHVSWYVYHGNLDKAFNIWTNYLWKGFELNSDFTEVKLMMDKARKSL